MIAMPFVMMYPGGCGLYLCDAELVSMSVPLMFIAKASFSMGHGQSAWVLCSLLPQCLSLRGWDSIQVVRLSGATLMSIGYWLQVGENVTRCVQGVSSRTSTSLHLCPRAEFFPFCMLWLFPVAAQPQWTV